MRKNSFIEEPSVEAYFSFTALSRYKIMAWAPGCLGLSFKTRSAGGMGSQSSPARLGCAGRKDSDINATTRQNKNRWARFTIGLLICLRHDPGGVLPGRRPGLEHTSPDSQA